MRVFLPSLMTVVMLGGLVTAAHGNEASRVKAQEAMLLCESVDHMPASDTARKVERLSAGLMLSEDAVRLDENDARAHMALCCNLGKQLVIAGLSWRVFNQVGRLRAEIDRAHALDPEDIDVLVTKGELLHRLPSVLGGNKEAGLMLLRRAVELQPKHVAARLYLARVLAEDRKPGARASAYEALALAKRTGAVREQSEAQELLASLRE